VSRAETAFTRASCYLKEGFNCSQSILLTMQELYDMKDLVLKAATGFGGGVGNMGDMCGALSGGVMAIGLRYGRSRLEQNEEKERTYRYCAEWMRRFTANFGSGRCRDILKVDLRDPDKRKAYWSVPENREKCAVETVGAAARILALYLEETEAEIGG
jgi:C_GCAxxG_C_C family probable redox protein